MEESRAVSFGAKLGGKEDSVIILDLGPLRPVISNQRTPGLLIKALVLISNQDAQEQ